MLTKRAPAHRKLVKEWVERNQKAKKITLNIKTTGLPNTFLFPFVFKAATYRSKDKVINISVPKCN